MDPGTVTVFSGNAHPRLAQNIAHHLHIPLGKISVGRFSDGEANVEIMENVRGKEIFLVQSTCPPVSENLMELLVKLIMQMETIIILQILFFRRCLPPRQRPLYRGRLRSG